ncbi:MAG: rod shape-determining protein MreD [Hespellia sp.]|nr:rod shape-determining protein MreD [Hespellia sp.]
MKKIKRKVVTALMIILCFLLQTTVFNHLTLATIRPNLLLILTASFGFMRGSKEGLIVGFFSGLLIDIQFSAIMGFYALVYALIGFANGRFQRLYYDDDIKLPLFLISASEAVYGLVIYFFMYLLRSRFSFATYLSQIIIPELIYTVIITLGLYQVILFVNHRLEEEEKRSASKFV